MEDVSSRWGREDFVGRYSEELGALSPLNDPVFLRWAARYTRYAASPGTVLEQGRIWFDTDLRAVLPAIHVPTLLLHRPGFTGVSEEEMDYLRALIAGARVEATGGVDEQRFSGDPADVVGPMVRFADAIRSEEAQFDRVLATVLFTDIVDSTRVAAELGDRRWADLVQRHHAAVRAMLARYRGTEVDTAGDGFFATFDRPARGVKCAQAILEAVAPLGVQVRAGLHTGEVETIDGKVGGLAVVIGARVGALAGPSELLTSHTVKDLTAGSGLTFEDAGEHELKGVPDRWHLYRAVS